MESGNHFDILVAGGGLAGVAAAVSAARLGANTLLIERYGFLGGMGTAGLVNPFMSSSLSSGEPLVGGIYSEICARMIDMGAMYGRAFDAEALKYVAQEILLESGAGLLLHSVVTGALIAQNNILGLEVNTKSGCYQIGGDIIIDATGDADIAAMSGAPFEFGNPELGMAQAMTMMFTIGGVDVRKSLMYAKDHPDEMRFPKPPGESAVEGMLKSAVGVAGFYDKVNAARAAGEFDLDQDMVFYITLPAPGQVVVNTTHISGIDGTKSEDLTRAEIEGRRQVFTLMKFFNKYVPGFENARLLQTATQVGVRETRRIIGEYVFNVDDVKAGRKFLDAVMRSAYPVDIHSSAGKGYSKDEDRLPPVAPPPGSWYEVPYRCLVPKDVDRLLVAGRCISATHEGQGAVRIMPNCIALGQAAGTAAAICVQDNLIPRAVDLVKLRTLLIEQGAII
ncbi:MAG: FAD-dependent oxidoreductase [Armatimonadota bacterium]